MICGLLSYLVVENLQLTIQEASLASEFVIRMLATSSPGKTMHLNGTDSADAGAICTPARSASQRPVECKRMNAAEFISLPPFSRRH
jgi:hypothetical protein